MFKYIYFIGTGCGRPISFRQLPGYLVGLPSGQSILLECGCTINTDTTTLPVNITQIDTIIITALNIELFAGLPALLHSMRLLNRAKTLRIIAPKPLHELIRKILTFDLFDKNFEIDFISIEQKNLSVQMENADLFIREAVSISDRFQVFLQSKSDRGTATLFYTGKAIGVSDKSLMIGYKFVIHDCTYSYEDSNLSEKTGLASYKDVIKVGQEIDPVALFLVHYSTRYDNPYQSIDKLRVHPTNIVNTYDGFRYDFLVLPEKKIDS